VLTVLKQMSARIRDVNRKFNEACLALHENEAAVSRGEKKSDDLVSRLEQIRTEAKNSRATAPVSAPPSSSM
jgi:methyl-accepting chemotaxis protein